MKRTIIRKMFTVTLATALAVGLARTAQAADKGCSSGTLTGTFAYTNTGTGFFTAAAPPLQAGPFAGAGVETIRWERRCYRHHVGKHKRQHIPGDYKGHIPGESGLHWHVNTRVKVSHDRGLPDSIILSPPGIGVGTKPQS